MTIRVLRYTIYHSPNAYLGSLLAEERLGALPIELERRPIHVPRERGPKIADLVGSRETKLLGGYHREDCRRWADRYGVELHFTPPGEFESRVERWAALPWEREELPARAYYASIGTGREAALDRALFEAAFVRGTDVNEEEVVRDAVARAGLEVEDLMARALADGTRASLDASLAAFDATGCPGVPTFVLEPGDGEPDQRFWGKDRVEMLVTAIEQLLRERGVAAPAPSPLAEGVEIRELAAADARVYVALRERALVLAPHAFESSPEDDSTVTTPGIAEKRLAEGSIESGNVSLGAFAGGPARRLVGFAGLYRESHRKTRHKLNLWGVFVEPEERGAGLGDALVARAVECAQAVPGAETLRLSVATSARAANHNYERRGFVRTGLEPRAMRVGDEWVDEIHMQLTLR